MLKIKNLKVKIKEKEILKNINLDIEEGEVHVLMGLNGRGKSTLVKSIVKHFDCDIINGEMVYKNKNLLDMEVNEISNEGIFMSFQNPIEIPGINNSYFLKTRYNEKRKYNNEEELNRVEFLKLSKSILNDYNIDKAFLNRNLNEGFSGGEKKKNEFLQMMLLKPDLIILDEIDSGLDIDSIKVISKGINDLIKEGKSVLMITHYDKLLKEIKPDFVHLLKNGEISKSGGYELAERIQKKGFEGV